MTQQDAKHLIYRFRRTGFNGAEPGYWVMDARGDADRHIGPFDHARDADAKVRELRAEAT